MRILFTLAALFVAHCAATSLAEDPASASALESEFLTWKASAAGQAAYQNGYVPAKASGSSISSQGPSAEELKRFQSAKDTILRLQKEQPRAKFSLQTQFALLTEAEFAAYVKRSGVQEHRKLKEQQLLINQANRTTAASKPLGDSNYFRGLSAQVPAADALDVDWQSKGCVSSIKDQGACGVCWAFAAVAALESGYCVRTNVLHELSVQDVVSCRIGTGSCAGGQTSLAYDWILHTNGGSICTEASYPYVSGSGAAPDCKRYDDSSFSCQKPDLGFSMYEVNSYGDHALLEAAVREHPVSTQLFSGNSLFQYYYGGVLMR